jgi:predicted AAA+ superfamily ATPase
MNKRNRYLHQIAPFIDKPVIKVITGIRRCGKSTFIKLLINNLKEKNIPGKNIIYINKDSLQFDFITGYKELNKYVISKLKNSRGKKYVFIDEIQEITEWEKAVTSFLTDNIADIYITGSNANLLSSELATLLTGRYIEIKMNTLVFSEFLQFRNKTEKDKEQEFANFLKYGGFPGIHQMQFDDEVIRQYINALYNTVFLKDVIAKNKIRDISLLEKLAKYIANNCGNITSAKNISDYIRAQKIKTSVDTIQNYIFWLINANFINKVNRYDIKGKRHLEQYEKYFLSDIGFIYSIIGDRTEDLSGKLENIVYLELISRGYNVHIGKLYSNEIDFIATKGNDKIYFQVTYSLLDNKVIEREFGVLEKLKDNYPKIVLSLDKYYGENRNGIKWYNLIDFLLNDKLK